ncbi:peptidase M28 [Halobacteriales archaeon QS_1_68_20]|nr:MAG: peptidase M28 [Halobacteriales archaeon QS_1_68_20]
MARLPDEVVGDAYTSTFAWDLLEDLVDVGNRMAGQTGEAEAAERLASAFQTAGLRGVSIQEFPIPGWWRGSSSLFVSGPVERTYEADHDVIALPGCPAGTASGELVDVGYGTDEEFETADVEGKVAMARSDVPDDHRWVHRMEKYANAHEGGAVGFVFRNYVEGALPPTGEVGYHERPGPIPAVGVSKELGARLARYAEGDDAGEVTLDVDCRNEPATSVNVEAVVEPEGATADGEVLLTAHLDAHDISEGANDNGAGSVLVTEAGRLLAQAADELDTRVRVVIFGAEEIGLYGAYHWAESRDLSNVEAVLNVDGAGTSRDLRVGTQGFDGLERLFESVTDDLEAPLSADDTVSPHGDQWAFVQEGVPAAFVTTTSETSGRGWGHTHADTLDKLDPRVFRDVAFQLAKCAVAAAEADRSFERRSRESVRDDLADGYVRELKVGGRWPYGAE